MYHAYAITISITTSDLVRGVTALYLSLSTSYMFGICVCLLLDSGDYLLNSGVNYIVYKMLAESGRYSFTGDGLHCLPSHTCHAPVMSKYITYTSVVCRFHPA